VHLNPLPNVDVLTDGDGGRTDEDDEDNGGGETSADDGEGGFFQFTANDKAKRSVDMTYDKK